MHTLPQITRFMQKVSILDNGCWQWTAYIGICGYGEFSVKSKRVQAHRWAYIHFVGTIPDGYQIDHLCRNRACVNPLHLEAVTPKVNTLRSEAVTAINARMTHCKRGHEFTPENTKTYRGMRHCRMCWHIRYLARSEGTPRRQGRSSTEIEAIRADRALGMTYDQLTKKYTIGTNQLLRIFRGES